MKAVLLGCLVAVVIAVSAGYLVLVGFLRRAAARTPPPRLPKAAAVTIWIVGGLYLAVSVTLAGLAVFQIVKGDAGAGVLELVPIAAAALAAVLLFRWPRLLLGWCGGAMVAGPAALLAAVALLRPDQEGGLAALGAGYLCCLFGFIGFLAGPVVGVLLGRWRQRRAARRN